MARRSSTPQAETAVTDETDVSVETVTDETETPVEAVTEAVTETPVPPVEVDLTDFKNAAEAAASLADEATGDLPKEAIDAVNKVYREIEGIKGKNRARDYLDEMMKEAISDRGDIMRARAFVDIKDGLTAAGGKSPATPRPPADPTAAFVQKVTAITLGYQELTSNVPEGVDAETYGDKVNELVASLEDDMDAYRAYLSSDDDDAEVPEVSPIVRQAFKLSAVKGGSGGSTRVSGGPRRDIEVHMNQVFSDLEVGAFLTINEIAKLASTEYGDDRPSAGAISARLFPKGRPAYKSATLEAKVGTDARGAVKLA